MTSPGVPTIGAAVPENAGAKPECRKLEGVLEVIRDRSAEAHTVPSLAKLAGMSRSLFSASFRACFGRSPGEYLRGVRLKHAAEALRTSTVPIKTVGARAGYDSRTAFAQAFRRAFGVSPADFRASLLAEPPLDIDAVSKRLRLSTDAPQSLAWEVNLANGAVWWSEGTLVALGYAKTKRLIADVARFYERIHPSERERVAEEVAIACSGGDLTWVSRFDFLNAHGTYIPIANACLIYRDANGTALRLFGVMQILRR